MRYYHLIEQHCITIKKPSLHYLLGSDRDAAMAATAAAPNRKVTYPVAVEASTRALAMGPYASSRDLSSSTPQPGGSPATITEDGWGAAGAGVGTSSG